MVAAFVSLGRWNAWVLQVVPFIRGEKVLEIGFGPGHLQLELHKRGFQVFGLDESPQMVKQASQRLRRQFTPSNLTQGLSQNLPFASVFETIIATFPSEYIFDLETVRDIARTLVPGGRLVVLLSVFPGNAISQSKLANVFINTLWPSGIIEFNRKLEKLCSMYEDEGIKAEVIRIPKGSVTLLILQCEKPSF